MATEIPANASSFTLRELAFAVGGELFRAEDEGARVVGIVTDSRVVRPGNVFVALRGDSFDGHAFVEAAILRGATAVIAERGRGVHYDGAAMILVDDGLRAFGLVARDHLRRWRRARAGSSRTAALTGSAGKTTTKELTAAILAAVGPCHATVGNLNNRIGVPAVGLAVSDERFFVCELGMSVPGEIAALTGIVEPDVAALLNVGVAHAEGFGGSRARIAREKGAIFDGLATGGIAVFGIDDESARGEVARTTARHVGFGRSMDADVRLLAREPMAYGGSRVTVGRGGETFDVILSVPGEAAALDLVAAIAIADATAGVAISCEIIKASLTSWRAPAGRAVIIQLADDVLVVDDSYNANPASMRSSLATVREIKRAGRRRALVVLGEMRELGPLSEREHDELGDVVAREGVDLLIGCGGAADIVLRRATKEGVPVRFAADAAEAGAIVAAEARPGDVVLFKGSRGASVERALAVLVVRHPPVATRDAREP